MSDANLTLQEFLNNKTMGKRRPVKVLKDIGGMGFDFKFQSTIKDFIGKYSTISNYGELMNVCFPDWFRGKDFLNIIEKPNGPWRSFYSRTKQECEDITSCKPTKTKTCDKECVYGNSVNTSGSTPRTKADEELLTNFENNIFYNCFMTRLKVRLFQQMKKKKNLARYTDDDLTKHPGNPHTRFKLPQDFRLFEYLKDDSVNGVSGDSYFTHKRLALQILTGVFDQSLLTYDVLDAIFAYQKANNKYVKLGGTCSVVVDMGEILNVHLNKNDFLDVGEFTKSLKAYTKNANDYFPAFYKELEEKIVDRFEDKFIIQTDRILELSKLAPLDQGNDPRWKLTIEDDTINTTDMTYITKSVDDMFEHVAAVKKGLIEADNAYCLKDNVEPSYYQLLVRCVVRPRGPCKRLVIAHRLGSGKSISMGGILNQYLGDPRAKLLLFPTAPLKTQFFEDYQKAFPKATLSERFQVFETDHPPEVDPTPANCMEIMCNNIEDQDPKDFTYARTVKDITYVWKKKNDDEEIQEIGIQFVSSDGSKHVDDSLLGAPVLPMTFEDVDNFLGYGHIEPIGKFRKKTSYFEWGKSSKSIPIDDHPDDFLDNMVILADEIHLVFAKKENGKYLYNNLVNALKKAKHAVIAGFTGTIAEKLWPDINDVFGQDVELKNNKMKVRSTTGDKPKENMIGRLHFFDGEDEKESKFYMSHDVEFRNILQTRENVDKRNELRKGKNGEEMQNAFLTNTFEVDPTQLRLAEHYTTIQYLEDYVLENLCADENNPLYSEMIDHVAIYAPVVHALVTDVVEAIQNHQDGIMIITDRESGMELIAELLAAYQSEHVARSAKDNGCFLQLTGTKRSSTFEYLDNTTYKCSGQNIYRGSGVTDMKHAVKSWNERVESVNPRVVIIDGSVVKEGVNILGVSRVFSVMYFDDFSRMRQTFGRADRRCVKNNLGDKQDLTLRNVQYVQGKANGVNEDHSTKEIKEMFKSHEEAYKTEKEDNAYMKKFMSIDKQYIG
jgi:hypothetical protein